MKSYSYNGTWEMKGNLTHPLPKSLVCTDGVVGRDKLKNICTSSITGERLDLYLARSLGVKEWPVQTVMHRCSLLRAGSSLFPTGCCAGHNLGLPGGLQGQSAPHCSQLILLRSERGLGHTTKHPQKVEVND